MGIWFYLLSLLQIYVILIFMTLMSLKLSLRGLIIIGLWIDSLKWIMIDIGLRMFINIDGSLVGIGLKIIGIFLILRINELIVRNFILVCEMLI